MENRAFDLALAERGAKRTEDFEPLVYSAFAFGYGAGVTQAGDNVNSIQKRWAISMVSAAFLSACGENAGPAGDVANEPLLDELAPAGWADAAGAFVNRENVVTGYVALAESPAGGVLMRADLAGLAEGWHGIHLHQFSDCSDYAEGFKASGGHIDPDNKSHGLLNIDGSERADLPNIYAGADGRATAEIYKASIALFPSEAASADIGPYPLIDEDGFAIIVHVDADDHETQPIGGAGERVACAAIQAGL